MSRGPMDPRFDDEDAMLTRMLRAMFAPPGDEAYWSRLEASIMARVTGDAGTSWWSIVAGWVPAGVAAAAIALLVAGLALTQARTAERQIAYEQAIRGSAPVTIQTVVRPSTMSERDATLQLVLTR